MIARFLQNAPIRRKLALISTGTVSLALVLACTLFAALTQLQARAEMVERIDAVARITGDNAASALVFQDPESARSTLAALAALDDVALAVVYDRNGAAFASFAGRPRDGATAAAPAAGSPGTRFGADQLEVFRDVTVAGERVGTIYVRATLEGLKAALWRNALLALAILGTAAAVTLLLARRWTRTVSAPIASLAAVVDVIARDRDYAVRAAKHGRDEVGALVDGFNAMLEEIQRRDTALREAHDGLEARVAERTRELEQEIADRKRAEVELEQTHRKLLEVSRLGGMAEVATNVLHNVGNVLNSVNVSANLVADRMRSGGSVRLDRLVALLREHEQDLGAFLTQDARGRQIPAYLARLAEQLRADERTTVDELHQLRKNIDHIIGIVAMQQTYAKVSGVRETVHPGELVRDCVRLNEASLARHGVVVEQRLEAMPPMRVEKHKVLQILVNLVRNATLACAESGRTEKRIVLELRRHEGRVRLSVSDNGVGIPQENLAQVFNHGFTTRRDGHGFGLHSGALAASELGGSLQAHSDGPGRGATFTLDLPLEVSLKDAA